MIAEIDLFLKECDEPTLPPQHFVESRDLGVEVVGDRQLLGSRQQRDLNVSEVLSIEMRLGSTRLAQACI